MRHMQEMMVTVYNYGPERRESPDYVDKVIYKGPTITQSDGGATYAANSIRAKTLIASTKKDSTDGCKYNPDVSKNCVVEVKHEPQPLEIPDFRDASMGEVTVLGFDDRQTRMLSQQLAFMANPNCAKAFSDASLETPEEQINKGITIMSEDFLGSPYNDAQWAPNTDFAKEMRVARNNATYTNDATQIGPYQGRRYMVLTGRAFNEVDDYFPVSVAHSFIHSAGQPGRTGPLWTETGKNISVKTGKELPGFPRPQVDILPMHDLEYMGASYNRIIENCTPRKESRIGPARIRN